MLDIGWQELFLVALVALLVVGPKELPRTLRTVSLWTRRARQMAREFQDGLEDLAREADLEDIRGKLEREAKTVTDYGRSIDPTQTLEESASEVQHSLSAPALDHAPEKDGDTPPAHDRDDAKR